MTARPAVMAPPHAAEYAALVDRTRALVPLLAKHADRTEAAGSVVPEVVAALQDAGVFRIVQPRAVGGYEFPATSFFDVCATLARGCMSTAWVVGNLSSHHLLLAHWPVAAQDEVWSASRDTLIGASYVFTAGKVRRVAGGYRVEGQWPYSSGIDPCQWVTIGGLVEPDAPGGAPERRYFLLPRADYEILDTWQTSGLQGTGSKDVLFRDVFVPAHRTVGYDEMVEGRAPGLARHPGGLFRYPIPAGGGYVLLSSMFGAAAGAQLAAPDRQVVCSIGDGSVMYSASGFWSYARYGLPVLTVVWNNRNYQTVRHAYHSYGGRMASSGHYACMYLGDPDIDFVKLAESQGVKGERAATAAEFEAALKRGVTATRNGEPYLVEVLTARYGGGAESTWHEPFRFQKRGKA